MVASHLALNMNITVEGSMLFKLWPAWVVKREDFSETQNKLLLQSGMKNVWTLALDQELDRVPVSVSEWLLGSFVLILRRAP